MDPDMTFAFDDANATQPRLVSPEPAAPHHDGPTPAAPHHDEGGEREEMAEDVETGIEVAHRLHQVGDLGHLGMEGSNLAAEEQAEPLVEAMMDDALESGVALPRETALANVLPEAESAEAATNGLGSVLGPLGVFLGTHEMIEGVQNNDGTQATGGALGATSGTLGTLATIGQVAAAAPLAAVASAGAAGWGVGRAIDDWSGWAAGQMGVQRGVTTRGLDGGTNMVRDDRNVSERIATAMAPGAAAEETTLTDEIGMAISENAPALFGGERHLGSAQDDVESVASHIPGGSYLAHRAMTAGDAEDPNPGRYAATERLINRAAGGVRGAWHGVTSLFD
jgi:hypothetical protein